MCLVKDVFCKFVTQAHWGKKLRVLRESTCPSFVLMRSFLFAGGSCILFKVLKISTKFLLLLIVVVVIQEPVYSPVTKTLQGNVP